MEERKSALVIGGTGFIGRRLVKTLIDENVDVTIASRGNAPNPFGDKVKAIVLDRFSKENLAKSLSGNEYFDIFFDQVGFGPDDMEASMSALDGKIGHYVYTSSMSVYDGIFKRMDESDFDPLSYEMKGGGIENLGYSEGKRSAEAYLFKNSKVPATAARFSIVVGPDDVTGRFQFHIDRIQDGRKIVIPEPCGKMNFVWVEDAGRFLAWAGLNGVEGYYNVASKEGMNALEIVNSIGDELGKKARVVKEGEKDDTSPYYIREDRTESVRKAENAGFKFTPMPEWLPSVSRQTVESRGIQHNNMDYLNKRLGRGE